MSKIGTEKKIEDLDIKIKIGTTDKKNPRVIYVDGGFFLEPIYSKNSYSHDVKKIKTSITNVFSDIIRDASLSERIITNYETYDDRMMYGKKSFFSFQIHMLQKKMLNCNDIFDLIAKSFEKKYANICDEAIKCGFIISKNKN